MERHCLRKPSVSDRPPAVPAVGERGFPGGGPGPAVGADYEHIELVGAAGDAGDGCAGCGATAVQLPPTVPAVGESRFPGGRDDLACCVGAEHVEVIDAA